MKNGVFCRLAVSFGTAAQAKKLQSTKLVGGRKALAKALVLDSELFEDELNARATTKSLLTLLAARTKKGEQFFQIEETAKAIDVLGYVDGYDAYAEIQEAFFLVVVAAHAGGATAKALFFGDVGLTEEFVCAGLRTEGKKLVSLTLSEPQDLTKKDISRMEADFDIDFAAVSKLYAKFLGKHTATKKRIERAGRAAYLRKDGSFAIEPIYRELGAFHEGLAFFENAKHDWGYVDEAGKEVIRGQYATAGDFREGLGRVQTDDMQIGFLDPKGTWAIKPTFEEASDFNEGRATFTKDGLSGFIDRKGAEVIPARFGHVSPFTDGLALACEGELYGDDTKWGYLDPKGAWAIAPTLGAAYAFREGYAPFMDKKEKWGLLDRKGDVALRPMFKSASFVDEGLIIGIDAKLRWGLYTPNGEVVIPSEHTSIERTGSIYQAQKKSAVILYDKKGKQIGNATFAAADRESEGLIAVQPKKNGPWGYIDPKGAMVIPPRFTRAFAFGQKHALAVEKDGLVVIDRAGKVTARPPLKDDVVRASAFGKSEVAWFEVDDAYGLVTLEGRVIQRATLSGVDRLDDALIWIKYEERG